MSEVIDAIEILETTITVDSHETGTRDITFRDAAGNTLIVAVAFLRRGDPPRQSSATFDRQGTVIPNEGGGSR